MTIPTRRALLGSAGLAGVALIAPAIAHSMPSGSPAFRHLIAADNAAKAHFNYLPRDLEATDKPRFQAEVDCMIAAAQRADAAVPTNWQELAQWVEHVSDEGCSCIGELNQTRLVAHVRRLAKQEA